MRVNADHVQGTLLSENIEAEATVTFGFRLTPYMPVHVEIVHLFMFMFLLSQQLRGAQNMSYV